MVQKGLGEKRENPTTVLSKYGTKIHQFKGRSLTVHKESNLYGN